MRLVAAAAIAFGLTALGAAQQARQPAPSKTPPRTQPRAPAPARREMAVPFKAGETLTYDVSWLQFVTAGTAVTRVVERKPSNGSTAYTLVADGRPIPLVARFYPVYYKMDSLFDAFTGLSQWTSTYSEERGRKRLASTRFDRAARRAFYEDSSDPSAKRDLTVPAGVQDGLATLYSIRGRTFKARDRFSVPVADDGSLYSVEFEVVSRERVYVPFGDVDAWNLRITVLDAERQPVATNTAAWISTDARRLPVKLQSQLALGSFVLALRNVVP
jgi:hypothetical protein